MNNMLTRLLSLTALLSAGIAFADVVPYIAIRSQGFNAARELVGWQTLINRYDMDCFYGAFSITPEYTRTFKGYQLAEALFCDALTCKACDNHCATFLVQGTKVPDRTYRALMAENFYLPTDYSSEVTIQPRIDNFLVDLNFYMGLDEWYNGLYFRIHTPICHTRWNLNFCENIINKGTLNYDPGYFNDALEGTYHNQYGINRGKMLESFEDFIVDNGAIEGVQGIICNSLNHARISKCELTRTRLAELTAAFGWNVVNRENGTFGISLRAAAPTGNRPEACYLFEPIVGNGHHWELGFGINSRWCMWRACDENDDLSFYFDANVTHLFKTCQCRTFDLCGKPLSRYMLAMKFNNNAENLLAGSQQVAPDYQFTGEYMPVANLTTFAVDVSASAQADLAFKFAYTHSNFQCDIGYDFWARSCLNISPHGNAYQSNFSSNTWALKGDAFMYGFTTSAGRFVEDSGVALSSSENNATIFTGTNEWPTGIDDLAWNQNPGIDNRQRAYNDTPDRLYTSILSSTIISGVDTSLNPEFISSNDFDLAGARTNGISHKVFAHFGYIWKDRQDWQPFLGLGAEVEFAHHGDGFCCSSCNQSSSCHDNCHANKKPCCKTIALTQWGVWIKGGVGFD
jgi:hypothetical protein